MNIMVRPECGDAEACTGHLPAPGGEDPQRHDKRYVWYLLCTGACTVYRYVYCVGTGTCTVYQYVYGRIFFCRVLEIFSDVFFNVDAARKIQRLKFFCTVTGTCNVFWKDPVNAYGTGITLPKYIT